MSGTASGRDRGHPAVPPRHDPPGRLGARRRRHRPHRRRRGPRRRRERPADRRPARAAPARPAVGNAVGVVPTGDGLPRADTAPEEERGGSAWVRGTILLSILVVLAVTLAPTAAVPPPAARRDRGAPGQGGPAAAERGRPAAGAGAVGRPGLRRAAGAGAAEVRQGGRPVLQRHRPGDRGAETAGLGRRRGTPGRRERPWYGQVWQSVRLADQPSAGMAPVPDEVSISAADLAAASRQRGREMRGVVAVAHRLPVRRAGRGPDRAAAARRHAVPDDLLRHVPPAHRARQHPRVGGT